MSNTTGAKHGTRELFPPLLAFVDDVIYLNSNRQGRQEVIDVTSRLYSMLGLERNGAKCFSA